MIQRTGLDDGPLISSTETQAQAEEQINKQRLREEIQHRVNQLRESLTLDRKRAMVCDEILRIAKTYNDQIAKGNLDTPGGLEHMGDVWRMILRWESLLNA